ncbi:hypothetical protein X975_04994, partial [Stegodyphus mimosarum]
MHLLFIKILKRSFNIKCTMSVIFEVHLTTKSYKGNYFMPSSLWLQIKKRTNLENNITLHLLQRVVHLNFQFQLQNFHQIAHFERVKHTKQKQTPTANDR